MNISQFIPNNKNQVIAGVVGGIVVSIIALVIINMLFWSFPMNPMVYTYDYSNGTSPTSPFSETSVNIHGSSVALSNENYSVEYSDTIVMTETNKTLYNVNVEYTINNSERTGTMNVLKQQQENSLSSELITVRNQTVTANNSQTVVQSHLNNTTQTFETGSPPILLQNQLQLPKAYVTTTPHINWEVSTQKTVDGEKIIIYKPDSFNASQSSFQTISSVNGTLRLNSETGIITYEVTTTGTMMVNGQEQKVTQTQAFSYIAESE